MQAVLDDTLSDGDQTASDRDQTWSDQDQSSSDSDQQSAVDDQLAADFDLASGGDARAHLRSALARERSRHDRALVAALREETGVARLRTAEERDQAAALRDRGAEGRDRLARLHDLEEDNKSPRHEILVRARRDRARAAADRAKAAEDRVRAADDRRDAAERRTQAALERAEFSEQLTAATRDELTGAWSRSFGLDEASRELERAHRTGTTLSFAFVDVDELKQLNDSQGHLAGDALLRVVGGALRANLRTYDVIVRYGGDEFICAMPDLQPADARIRLQRVASLLKADNPKHSITFGLAEAEPADSLRELIARADTDLLETRHRCRP
jgi:diguanylate cyclase (GGDEF)-like protein